VTEMKQTIKSIAADLFYSKGYFATSISEIARKCNIQKASIYYHYPSKEAVLFSIMETTMDDLVAHLHRGLEGAFSVEERVRAAVRGHVIFHLERQKENFIANSELRGLTPEHYEKIVEKRDAYERIFQGLIREGMEAGIFSAEDIKILSYAILALCTSGAFWYNSGGRLSALEIAEIYETFILRGLKRA
jgi:AcrR family transcriptional regulator